MIEDQELIMENIEIYYDSIKEVYDQISKWENRPEPVRQKTTNFIIGFAGFIFTATLIPIIPSVFVFVGSQFGWSFGTISLHEATIWTYAIAWLIGTIGTFLILLGAFWLDNKINPAKEIEKRKAPQSLSAEQLTFIFVFGAYKELKIFFISRIDQHVKNALDLLAKLQRGRTNYDEIYEHRLSQKEREIMYMEHIDYPRIIIRRRTQPSLIRQVSIAREFLRTFGKYPWLQIDEESKSRLQALISFQKKILIRLQKREDLPAVLTILEDLSKFFYAFLPEHQTNMVVAELSLLQQAGISCLDRFVKDVNNLIEYPVEPKRGKREKSIQPSLPEKLQAFYLNYVIVRFTGWLILLLVITSGLVFLISLRVSNLDINIMVSMVIATSITGAAGLAVFSSKDHGLSKATHRDKEIQDEIKSESKDPEE